MISKSIPFFGLLLIVVTGYLAWQTAELKNDNLALQGQITHLKTDLTQQKDDNEKLKAQLAGEENSRLQQDKDRQSEHARLVEIYRQELEKLNQQKLRLDEIKNRNKDADISALQAQLHTNEDRIKSLEQDLTSYKGAERDLGGSTNQALRDQTIQNQRDLSDINAKIAVQQVAIRSTQDQINFWNRRRGDINQTSKLQEYAALLQQQQMDMQTLKANKADLQANNKQNINIVKSQAGVQRTDIHDSEGQIREQLNLAKAEGQRLQGEIQQKQKAHADMIQQIHQAEELYDLQYTKTKNAAEAAKPL